MYFSKITLRERIHRVFLKNDAPVTKIHRVFFKNDAPATKIHRVFLKNDAPVTKIHRVFLKMTLRERKYTTNPTQNLTTLFL
ncbi:MAG: hypothetical protein LBK06_08510 [Planctomycetaceae bacterium]|nr:hypothetical protein [Planctomycetaceae bacterium]